MSNFTKIRDLNLRILESFDDETLFKYCITDRYANELCMNEGFWQRRFMKKFTDGQEQWRENKTWRQYYLLLTRNYETVGGYIDKKGLFFVKGNMSKTGPYFLCSQYGKLSEIFWKLRFLPKNEVLLESKQKYIETLNFFGFEITNFSDDKIKFYYSLFLALLNECQSLKDFMLKYNLIRDPSP